MRRKISAALVGLALLLGIQAAPAVAGVTGAPKHLSVQQAAPKHLAVTPLAFASGWSAYRRCDVAGANDYKIRVYFRGSAVGYQPDDMNVAWNQAARPGTNFDNVNGIWMNVSETREYQGYGYGWASPIYGPTTFDLEPSGYTVLPSYSYVVEMWKGNTKLCTVHFTRA